MKTIAKTEYYIIATDAKKNRLYLTIKGFWKNRSVVPNYVSDLQKATTELSNGYTVITDITEIKTPPPEIVQLHTEAQRVALSAGLKKTAEVVGQDIIAQMTLKRSAQDSGMTRNVFGSKEEAERWLDAQ